MVFGGFNLWLFSDCFDMHSELNLLFFFFFLFFAIINELQERLQFDVMHVCKIKELIDWVSPLLYLRDFPYKFMYYILYLPSHKVQVKGIIACEAVVIGKKKKKKKRTVNDKLLINCIHKNSEKYIETERPTHYC